MIYGKPHEVKKRKKEKKKQMKRTRITTFP